MKIIESGIKEVVAHESTTIVAPCNIYKCVLKENVFIGPFTEIQANVVIGTSSRIQSHSFICEGTTIGKNCFIGHGVVFINDLFAGYSRAHGDKEKYQYPIIEDNVLIGSGSVIQPYRITNGCIIGSGAVVTRDLLEKGVYAGVPAKLIRKLP